MAGKIRRGSWAKKHLTDVDIRIATTRFQAISAAVFRNQKSLKRNSKALDAAVGNTKRFTEVRKTVHRLKKQNPRAHGLPNLLDETIQCLEAARSNEKNGKRKGDERRAAEMERMAAGMISVLVRNGLTTKEERAAALSKVIAKDFRECQKAIEAYEIGKAKRPKKDRWAVSTEEWGLRL